VSGGAGVPEITCRLQRYPASRNEYTVVENIVFFGEISCNKAFGYPVPETHPINVTDHPQGRTRLRTRQSFIYVWLLKHLGRTASIYCGCFLPVL
jgi:hypothetical protein